MWNIAVILDIFSYFNHFDYFSTLCVALVCVGLFFCFFFLIGKDSLISFCLSLGQEEMQRNVNASL